jgi:hypothetical protein|tara:strand:+ start:745 stop:1008 length:264 start_codon:yes stop_codon:yes gene_type:complete
MHSSRKLDKEKIEEIAEKYSISFEQAKEIVYSPYELMKEKLGELTLEDELTEEEFYKKKTNFNMPSLFKLFASYYAYKEIMKKKKKL